jgi:hypothetical protein
MRICCDFSAISKPAGKQKHRWRSCEKKAIERQLGKYIRLGRVPGKLECLEAIRKESDLKHYADDWKKIKFCAYNIIQSRKRNYSKVSDIK